MLTLTLCIRSLKKSILFTVLNLNEMGVFLSHKIEIFIQFTNYT